MTRVLHAAYTQPFHLHAIVYDVRAQLAAVCSGVVRVHFPDLTRVAVVELQVERHIDFPRWCSQFRNIAGKPEGKNSKEVDGYIEYRRELRTFLVVILHTLYPPCDVWSTYK